LSPTERKPLSPLQQSYELLINTKTVSTCPPYHLNSPMFLCALSPQESLSPLLCFPVCLHYHLSSSPHMFALSSQQQSPLSPQQQSPIVLCALSCHYVSCSYTPPTSNQNFIHSLYESCAGFDLCRSFSFSLLLLTIQY